MAKWITPYVLCLILSISALERLLEKEEEEEVVVMAVIDVALISGALKWWSWCESNKKGCVQLNN